MGDSDLRDARLARLRQHLDATVPKTDLNLAEDLFRLLAPAASAGLDVIRLTEPVFRRFGACPAVLDWQGLPAAIEAGDLGFEDLPARPRATLWPYRPRILEDELLSSWLWRVACGIDASPKRFAIDAIGTQLADVDREIDDAAIERLAFLSGHTPQQLLRGTLRADVEPDIRDQVQRLLLRHGDLVLTKRRGGRTKPVIQYCPVCLGADDPYLPRGWRFSLDVVCVKDGCFLIDSCWRCGGLLDPLAQTAPSRGFTCVECSTPFATAPSLRMDQTLIDQDVLYSRLRRLARPEIPEYEARIAFGDIHRLSSGDLRGTNPRNPALRHNAVMLEAIDPGQSVLRPDRKRSLAAMPSRSKRGKTPPKAGSSKSTASQASGLGASARPGSKSRRVARSSAQTRPPDPA